MTPTPRFAAVVFDCDSTLAALEGIDALCAGLPAPQAREVAALTAAAMNGEVPLADVYARRLDIVRPSASDLEAVGRAYVEHVLPGTQEVVGTLEAHGVDVAIVSGGLAPAVCVLAEALGLPAAAVHAVDVLLHEDGSYADFDRASPLARNHGKVEVLADLRARRSPLLFVGDGVTDLEARGVVDRFVGFGGVVERAAVRAGADRYVVAADLRFVLDEVFPGGVIPPPPDPGPRAR